MWWVMNKIKFPKASTALRQYIVGKGSMMSVCILWSIHLQLAEDLRDNCYTDCRHVRVLYAEALNHDPSLGCPLYSCNAQIGSPLSPSRLESPVPEYDASREKSQQLRSQNFRANSRVQLGNIFQAQPFRRHLWQQVIVQTEEPADRSSTSAHHDTDAAVDITGAAATAIRHNWWRKRYRYSSLEGCD